jgi:hypothetical protein
MKKSHALIFALSLVIVSLAIPPTAFSKNLSNIDQECQECHSEFEPFEVVLDSPSEVPVDYEFEYKVIVQNNGEHEVQGIEAIIDLSEAGFLETSLMGGEPYSDVITDSVGVGETATYTFPITNGAISATIILEGDDGILGLNDLDMTVRGAEGGNWQSAGSGPDEAVGLDRRDFRQGGYGDYTVEVVWFIGNPSIAYTLTIDVEYGADQIIMEGPDLKEGEEHTFVIPLTSLDKGDNTINVAVAATAHHEHTEEDDSVTSDNYDYVVEGSSSVKVGDKFVYNPPSESEKGTFSVLIPERVLGLLSMILLFVSIGFSSLLRPVSSRIEKIVGGAANRVKLHCRISQGLLGIALIHGLLLPLSPHATSARGLLLGVPAFLIMGFLGYIGWQQNTLRPKWGNEKWKKVHLIFTVLAVVIVILHAMLDGSDFAWLI